MAWSKREKEIAAVGISVAAGCRPCTDYHVRAAREAGATARQIEDAVLLATAVRDGATALMEGHALSREGAPKVESSAGCGDRLDRTHALVAVGAAYAVACTSTLSRQLCEAERAGLDESEISAVVQLAQFIRDKAKSHVDRVVAQHVERRAEAADDCSCS